MVRSTQAILRLPVTVDQLLADARVARGRDSIRRVAVIGPTHHMPVRGVALSGVNGFRTPLGVLPVAEAWAEERLVGVSAACVFAETHRWEHAVEVQLPFLQRALGDVEIVPLLAGDGTRRAKRLPTCSTSCGAGRKRSS
jgi:MEMO1 family protein